jgi:hypothetical protein
MTLEEFLSAVEAVFQARSGFSTRPDIGPASGLIQRELRYFMGNPIRYTAITSTGAINVQILKTDGRERSALCVVGGSAIVFRTDGTVPTSATDQTMNIGTTFLLTGIESIQGFSFSSNSVTPAVLYVNYFD